MKKLIFILLLLPLFTVSQDAIYKISEVQIYENKENEKPNETHYGNGLVIVDGDYIILYHNYEFIKYKVLSHDKIEDRYLKIEALDDKLPIVIRMLLRGGSVYFGFDYGVGYMLVETKETCIKPDQL